MADSGSKKLIDELKAKLNSSKGYAIARLADSNVIQVPSRVLLENPYSTKGSLSFNQFVNQQVALNVAAMVSKITQIPARYVIPNPEAKDQRWYILIYIVDQNTGKRKRKRLFNIIGNTPAEKKKDAEQKVRIINEALAQGFSFDNPVVSSSKFTLQNAIDHFKASRKHSRSYGERLDAYIKPYVEFCRVNKLLRLNVAEFDAKHAIMFDTYLKSKDYSNRTINNYMSYAKTLWHQVADMHEEVNVSPFLKIKKLPTTIGRNLAFTQKQIDLITEQHKLFPDLELLAKFMYYTLARTNELALMQVQHINMYNAKQLYIPAANSKNQHERHINIPPALYRLIIDREILTKPPLYYVLSTANKKGSKQNPKYKQIEPSATHLHSSRLGERYRNYILKPLGFSKDYTLYSWKHTGVINAHRAGVTDADIMQQTGHRSYESFTKYMKSLGLFAAGQFGEKIPEI